ncbi:hypothetical protein JKY79_00785 [Candidatus Babeliales bacterium]|nr:hypothetical protein [Candidatus Babeliales bacterium]
MFSLGLHGAPSLSIQNGAIGSGSSGGISSFIAGIAGAPGTGDTILDLNFNNAVEVDGVLVVGAYDGAELNFRLGGSLTGGTNATVVRSGLSAETANTGTKTSLIVYAEAGGRVFLDVFSDTYFSSGLHSTVQTSLNNAKTSYVAGSSLENTITFSGAGEVYVSIWGGSKLSFDSLFRVDAGSINADSMTFELNDGTVDGTLGTRAFILMDQTGGESSFPKVTISRDAFDSAGSEDDSILCIGCDSTMTFLSKDATGDIDDSYANLTFDVSNYGFGRLDLEIRGGNTNCFHDGAFLMYGCWLDAADYEDPTSFANDAMLRRFAGINAIVSLTDAAARLESDYTEYLNVNNIKEYPFYDAGGLDDLSRRSLRVVNNCRSLNPFSANVFADFDFRQAAPGTFDDRGSQVGCVLGGNGTLFVGHNTFFDYVSTTSPIAYDADAMGLTNLSGIATGIFGGNPEDKTKKRSPGAFLIDNIDFTPLSSLSDTIYVDYVNHGERPVVWCVGQSALYFRCCADDAGTFDGALLSPGFGFYDGTVLNPGGLTASPDGHMALDAEGGPIFYHSDDGEFGTGLGVLNVPPLLLNYAGQEIFLNGDIIDRPLEKTKEYDSYQKSYMFFNSDTDFSGMTIVNNDVLHLVLRDRLLEPIIVGGESAHWFGGGFAMPILRLSNTFLECHESIGISGVRLVVNDAFGPIGAFGFGEPDSEFNNSAIICYNHGDDYDKIRGFGRVIGLGTDLNLFCDGTTAPELDSAFLNVFRSHNQDDSLGLPVQLTLEVAPEPFYFWDSPSLVPDDNQALQVFFLANEAYMEIGWRDFDGFFRLSGGDYFPQNIFPWGGVPFGDEDFFSNDFDETQQAELFIAGNGFAFESVDSLGNPAPSVITTFGQPGVLYVGYGGKLVLIDQNPITPHAHFDIPIGILNDSLSLTSLFAEVDIASDQAFFGPEYGVQPYAIDLDFLGGAPYDIASLFKDRAGIVRILWGGGPGGVIRPAGFLPLKSNIEGIDTSQYRSLKSSSKSAGIDRNGRKRQGGIQNITRATTPINLPVIFSGSYITVGPDAVVEQFQVMGSIVTDQFHLHLTGDGLGYSTVREMVWVPQNILGEGSFAAIVMDQDAHLGLGSREFNEHSVRAMNLLGDSGVTIFPNGNCVIELNEDLIIHDLNAIVPTELFGDVAVGERHRITFISKTGKSVIIPEGGELNLGAFGQFGLGGVPLDADAIDTQQISFAGNAQLIVEPGATIRFPNVEIEKAPILYMNDQSKLIFKSDRDNNKPAPAYSSDLDKYRSKIKGVGKIWLNRNATMEVFNESMVSIECDGDGSITPNSFIQISIQRDAQMLIGGPDNNGGAFQVGNLLPLSITAPNYGVAFSLRINGAEALANIGKHGFVGFGAGVLSQAGNQVNTWDLIALHNVAFTEVQVLDGTFSHNQIYDGGGEAGAGIDPFGTEGALLAVGPAAEHAFIIGVKDESKQPVVRGGGNVVMVTADATAQFDDLDATPDNPLSLVANPILSSSVELIDDVIEDNGRYSILGSTDLIRQKSSIPLGNGFFAIDTVPGSVDDAALQNANLGFGTPRGFFQYICHQTVRNQTPRRFASFGLNDGQRRAAYIIGELNLENNIVRREDRMVAGVYGNSDYAVSVRQGYLRVATVNNNEDPGTFSVAHDQ